MKFIHTSDWHLGRILNGVHLTEDQRIILDSLKDILKEEKPDALVIAGDIYDRSVPPVEAVELFSSFIESVLLELNIPIIAMAGNHDSAERIHFGSKLLSQKDLYMVGKSSKGYEKITLKDKEGEVDFFVVPYSDPAYIRANYKIDTIRTHNEAFEAINERILEEKTDNRNVMVAHGFVQGGDISSDSERPLSIGGSDIVSTEYFRHYNYTALGHLHAPQRVGEDYIRYSGSLMKYSVSEATQKKSVYIVEIDKEGEASYTTITLKPPKDLRVVKGLLDDIIETGRKDENNKDYIMVILEDEGALLDPMEKIRSVYPNAIGLKRTFLEKQHIELEKKSSYEDYNKMSIGNLFEDFYSVVMQNQYTWEHKEIFENIIRGIERD